MRLFSNRNIESCISARRKLVWERTSHHFFRSVAEDRNKVKPTKWAKSEAKFLLRDDIIGGVVTKDMKPKEVYEMRPCYKDYKYTNFRTNLRTLRVAVKKDLGQAEEDEAAYLHDKSLFGKDTTVGWHRSEGSR